MVGAAGTPYAGGVFRMKLVLGAEFPQVPPKGDLPPLRAAKIATAIASASLTLINDEVVIFDRRVFRHKDLPSEYCEER